jgi:hypothetical protein
MTRGDMAGGPAHATIEPQTARAQASPAAGWNALLLAAFVVGIALRVWQIDIQILIDDEWHAIHKLLRSAPTDILTHLGYADYSIPLTLYYQWLYRTIGLSEWGMHLPPLIAGIGLLLVGPSLLARSFALRTRAVWTALVAISPLLVYHSKVARPYALTSLFSFVAILAFRVWWERGRRRDAAIYVVTTVLAGWLHAITLPFTLLLFVYCGVRALRPFDGASMRRLLALALLTGLLLALALLPPFVNDWGQFSQKAGRDAVTAESLYRTALMLAGTGSPLVATLFWVSVAAGARRLLRRDADFAWYLVTVIGVAGGVVASSGAEWISHPLVLARYLLPALPFVLLLAAEGVVWAVEGLRRPFAQAAASGVLAAGLFVGGPIEAQWHFPNQFWGHLRYQFDYDPAHNPYMQLVPNDPIPAFYRELSKLPPGSVTLIEMPWRLESHFNAQSLYQSVHHQLIRIGLVTPACGTYDFGEYPEERKGMKMRELVHLTSILRGDTRGADYLVIHVRPASTAADLGTTWPDMKACLPAIEAKLGAPASRDDQIVVFALAHLSPLGNTRRTVQQ